MAKAKTAPVPTDPTTELVEKYLKLKAKSSQVFRDANEIEEQLLRTIAGKEDAKVPLADGRVLTRKDNFADKNTFFKPSASKRFEVVVA